MSPDDNTTPPAERETLDELPHDTEPPPPPDPLGDLAHDFDSPSRVRSKPRRACCGL